MTNTTAHMRDASGIKGELDDIKRRLRDLESSPQLTASSVKEGSIQALNASSAPQVIFGKQPGGGYGISVLDPVTGLFPRIAPPQEAAVLGPLTTTSTTYVDLSGPSVTVTIGQAGQALVMPSSVVGLPASVGTQQGVVGISVDGGVAATPGVLGVSTPGAALQATASNSILVTGLAAGSHTFKMVFKSTFGQSINFGENSLVVIPY